MSGENKGLVFTGMAGAEIIVHPGELIAAAPCGNGTDIEFRVSEHIHAVAHVGNNMASIAEAERAVGRPLGYQGKPWRRTRV